MRVRLTQLDGKLPNLALMKLSHWHRANGDEVVFTRQAHRDLLERDYDRVYGSAIFDFSSPKLARFLSCWPEAIIGGTGTGSKIEVEDVIGLAEYEHHDYTPYPTFKASIGYTQRGCRLACKFCVVRNKEGLPRSVNSIADIWRGPGHKKQLHLLDNDFFGQPEATWQARIREIRDGGFKVSFNQGINVRFISPAAAEAMASVEYRDDGFQERRLYTAWDNLKEEAVFFRGIDTLEAAGIPPKHVMVYMLVGWDKRETWERIWTRFSRMVARGVLPYPMVWDTRATDPLGYRERKRFQRWVVTGLYRAVPFHDYDTARKAKVTARHEQLTLFGNRGPA